MGYVVDLGSDVASVDFTLDTLISALIVALLSYSVVMIMFWTWNKIVLGK